MHENYSCIPSVNGIISYSVSSFMTVIATHNKSLLARVSHCDLQTVKVIIAKIGGGGAVNTFGSNFYWLVGDFTLM